MATTRGKYSRRPRYTREHVLAAIRGSGGIMQVIATRLGCDWRTARDYVQRWQETRNAYDDEREVLLDYAEVAVAKATKEGDLRAAMWVLSRLGRHRGWGGSLDVTARGDVDIIIRWADDDSAQDD